MALIKTTAIVDSISGKIQGSVFARNKGGAYVRGRGVVTNPQTEIQMQKRAQFGSVSQMWKNLTTAERQSWIDAAINFPYSNRLGDQRFLTGKALFQKLNTNLELVNTPTINSAPAPQGSATLIQNITDPETQLPMVWENGGSEPELAIDASTVATENRDIVLLAYATPPLSAGVMSAPNRFNLISFQTLSGSATPTPVNGLENWNGVAIQGLAPLYVDHFGVALGNDQVMFLKFVGINKDTGEASAPSVYRVTIA